MKRVQAILAAIAAIAATIAGLDLTGFVQVLPPDLAKWLVIIPSGAAAVVHISLAVKLQLEKMEADIDNLIPLVCALCILTIFLPSCQVVGSAISGTPIPSTAVQRAGHDNAPVVLVSSADLAIAEAAPVGTIHGLYDAGFLVEKAREVVIDAIK